MKTFSIDQMMFAKKTLTSIVHNRGVIITVQAEKHPTKSGYSKVYSAITLQEDEKSALDAFFFKRFHQHLAYKVKGNTIEFTIL